MTYLTFSLKALGAVGAVAGGIAFQLAADSAKADSQRATLEADPGISLETTGSISKKKNETNTYTSTVRRDGSIEVVLKDLEGSADDEDSKVLRVYAPDTQKTELMLHGQDWYAVVDSTGAVKGIYTVPRGQPLPSNVLRSLDTGHAVLKTDPTNAFFKVFPSKEQLAVHLTQFTNAARTSVCAQPNKPKSLSASVDVTPGWTGAGRIRFDAKWDTADLCKVKKAAAKAD